MHQVRILSEIEYKNIINQSYKDIIASFQKSKPEKQNSASKQKGVFEDYMKFKSKESNSTRYSKSDDFLLLNM